MHASTIAWLGENLSPPLQFYVNDEPPMPHPDGYFDLVYAISVFTHITGEWSAWLTELHRVLKPDALLVATFMGPATWERAAKRHVEEDRLGMAVLELERALDETSGPIVLHSPWWIRSRWGRAFEIVSLQPAGFVREEQGHGLVVARRKDVSITRDDLEWPDPTEPREVVAQREQMALLEESAIRLRKTSERQIAAYTSSKSWWMTAPARWLGHALRRLLRPGRGAEPPASPHRSSRAQARRLHR